MNPTPEVLRAMAHIREKFPDVAIVVFNTDERWCYMDEDFNAPKFNNEIINVGILEAAVNSVPDLPYVYQIPKAQHV